jgi:hypothetical protein
LCVTSQLLQLRGDKWLIVLWSASILRSWMLARAVAIYGLLVGPAVVIAVVSGLRLDPRGARLLILGQSLSFIIVGTLLGRFKDSDEKSIADD